MASAEFQAWWAKLRDTGSISPLAWGATREQVLSALGEPDTTGGTSRKQRVPLIWKYEDLEIHFGRGDGDGLSLVCAESPQGASGQLWAIAPEPAPEEMPGTESPPGATTPEF